MKYRCTVSHEEPQEGGGFRRFEAGQEYESPSGDKGDFEGSPYFEKAVETPRRGVSTKTDKEVTGDDN